MISVALSTQHHRILYSGDTLRIMILGPAKYSMDGIAFPHVIPEFADRILAIFDL